MTHLILEIGLLLLAFFVLGCVLGCISRRTLDSLFEAGPAQQAEPAPHAVQADSEPAPQAEPDPAPQVEPEPPAEAEPPIEAEPRKQIDIEPAAAPSAASQPDSEPATPEPAGLSGPRVGGADDLKRISGIGPVLEKKLNELGYFHFDQIAGWSKENIAWVDDQLSFRGRIERDDWIGQAKRLAENADG